MVGCLDCAVQAQNPSASLYPLVAYEKSSSSVRIRNVPKKIGKWTITSVVLAAQYPDNTTKVANCVFVGTVWVGTIAGSEDVGEGVYTIYASGIDENGQPVNDYCLGSGQVTILAQEVRRDANAPVHMLYEEPTAEIREGDLFQSGETSAWMIFKDGQSVPIAEVDLTDYYQKSETSSAAEISTALENIDLSDCIKYPVLDAQTNEWTLSIAPQGDGIEDEQKVVFCSYEQSVPGQYTTYMQLGDGAPIAVTRDAPTSAAIGYARLKVGTQTVPIFRDMPTKTSQLSNDSEFPTPDNPGRFLRYTAYPSHPDRWIVNFGSSSAGGISLVSDGENPISSYIDIAGRRITAGGENQQAVNGRLASVGIVATEATEFIAVDDRPLAFVDQLSDYYKKSETSSASEISTAFENIDLSEYATKDEVSSLSDAVKFEADNDSNKTAVTIGTRLAGVGAQSLAVGTNNGVNGSRAFAAGAYNNVNANDSAAIGASNTVNGSKSMAIGYLNNISSDNSLAVGGGTTVAGDKSFAVGSSTSALGPDSFAGGNYTRASQTGSFAWGNMVYADSPLEASFGRCNKSHVYDSNLSNEASATIFSVGVGENTSSRANGIEVMVNGDTWMKGLGGYDGAELSTGIPLQQMFGTQFVLSGEYEDDTTFEISVYGYTPPPPPTPKWFTMKNVGDSSQNFIIRNVGQSVEYTLDGGATWNAFQGYWISVPAGGEISLRHLSSAGAITPQNVNLAGTAGQWDVYGNIMTLLDETGTSTTLSDVSAFATMFSEVGVVDASGLELPATTLANACYGQMFSNCTSLTAAPEVLPAMTLANSCYSSMFEGCSSLVIAPALPATTLADYCYRNMFKNCTALTEAPELPATTVPTYGYADMFQGCTNLTSISVSMPEWYYNIGWANTSTWVQGVSANGTFYCPAALGTNETIQRGTDYCPSNWTVVNI